MHLRQHVNTAPESLRAGVLFGLWCGFMCLLLGVMHLDNLLPSPYVRLACGGVGLLGLLAVVPAAEIYRRHGGEWEPEGWISGVGLMVIPLLGLFFVDFFLRQP